MQKADRQNGPQTRCTVLIRPCGDLGGRDRLCPRQYQLFLFDRSFLPHASPDTICDHFEVSKRTVAQKAKLIRDMFKLEYFDAEFSTEHMAKNNPLTRLRMVNGFLVIDEP